MTRYETRTNSGDQRGQILVMVALMLVPLLLLLGLAVDMGVLFYSRARLQRAVDASALSAAETFYSGANTTEKAEQFLSANLAGAPAVAAWNATAGTGGEANQLTVTATQPIPTLFMRIVPNFTTVPVDATATAVLDSYAEMPLKPIGLGGSMGQFGKEGEVNPSVFGPDARYSYGDAYSPLKLDGGVIDNLDSPKLPYGYLFRIYVPPSYKDDLGYTHLQVQLFDPDCYNEDLAVNEPQYLTAPNPNPPPATIQVVNPDWTADAAHDRADAYIRLNYYGNGWNKYFRVDEIRGPSPTYGQDWGNSGGSGSATTTVYTLWHFRTTQVNLNPFDNPTRLSDVGVVGNTGTYLAQATYGWNSTSDLKWVSPSGFNNIELRESWRESDDNGGGWNFYLYVKTVSGSSENGFDIRTGPPNQTIEDDVNDQQNHTWNSGGSTVLARRAYPMNNNLDANNYMYITQVPEAASGTTLQIRHYDTDNDSANIPYYIECVGCPGGSDLPLTSGKLSGNGSWLATGQTESDSVQIPARGTTAYNQIFPSGVKSAWLKATYDSSAQDSSVWEMIYIRPRLLK